MAIVERSQRLDRILENQLVHSKRLPHMKLFKRNPERIPEGIVASMCIHRARDGFRPIYDLFHEEFVSSNFGPLMDVRNLNQTSHYVLLKTTSADMTLDQWISRKVVQPLMRVHSYSPTLRHYALELLGETYKNSLLFASYVGKDDYYQRRDMTPPNKEQRSGNMRKKVYVEAFISDEICLFRVTDYGRGVDYEKVPAPSIPDNIGELSLDKRLEILENQGQGINLIKQRTGHTPMASGPNPFSTSFILYNPNNMSIRENREKKKAS